MGEEMRAFNNLRWYRATGDAPNSLIGLNGYGPNMNIARDPRYGRTRQACQCPFFCHSLLTSLGCRVAGRGVAFPRKAFPSRNDT